VSGEGGVFSFRFLLHKGFVATVLFLSLVVLVEWWIVRLAVLSGVKDVYALPVGFGFALSPLFHLLPLCVIVSLTASWLHLTKYVWLLTKPRKKLESEKKQRFRSVRSFFLRVLDPSYLAGRPSFAFVALKLALVMLALLVAFMSLGCLLAYPNLLEASVISFYKANPAFLGFVNAVRDFLEATAKTLAPLGGIASAVDNALKSAAPGFRRALEGLGGLIKPLVELDSSGKYIFCQNFAAFLPALITLVYCRYSKVAPKLKRYRGKP